MTANTKGTARIPKQRRSIERKERIMVTARFLFAQKGYHSVNSNQIASEAGVPVGSFYAYFKNKKALLLEMLNNFQAQFSRRIFGKMRLAQIRDLELEAIIRSYVTSAFKAFDLAPGLMKVAYPMRYYDADIGQIFVDADEAERDQIHLLLDTLDDKIRLKDREAAVIVIHSAVASVAHRSKLLGLNIEEERLVEEVVAMIYRYLEKQG